MLKWILGMFRSSEPKAFDLRDVTADQPRQTESETATTSSRVRSLKRLQALEAKLGKLGKGRSREEEMLFLEVTLHAGAMASSAAHPLGEAALAQMMCAGLIEKAAELRARLGGAHWAARDLDEMCKLVKEAMDPDDQIGRKLTEAAAALPARRLEFPTASVGELHMSTALSVGAQSYKACGVVDVPVGFDVQMIVNGTGARDLSWVRKMPPQAFARLEIERREVTDGQLGDLVGLSSLRFLVLPRRLLTENGPGLQRVAKTLPTCKILGGMEN